MKTMNKRLEYKIIRDVVSYVKQYQYCRLLISKDFKDYTMLKFNERYEDESNYNNNKLIISNVYQNLKDKDIKEKIKEFLLDIQYEEFMKSL